MFSNFSEAIKVRNKENIKSEFIYWREGIQLKNMKKLKILFAT